MYPGIELRTMRYIVAVGVELHFTHAAERVHVAQPSLSKQIRNVEEELGVELFKRDRNKKVEVTEPGRVFIENAQKALLYADRAASMARAASAGQLGKLLLGVSPHVDLQLFFRIRHAFEKSYPEIQFQFVTGLAREQAEWAMRSDIHAGLIELPIRYRGLAILSIFREPMVLVLPRNDQVGKSKVVTPAQLKKRPLILLSNGVDLAHDKILAGLESWGYRPEKILEVINLGQALDFVRAGEGVAVMRTSACRFESEAVAFRPMPALPTLDVGLGYRRDVRSPLVRNLLEVAREVFARERKKMIEDSPRSRNVKGQCQGLAHQRPRMS
jgi:LysR family hca operon transcriptional activator